MIVETQDTQSVEYDFITAPNSKCWHMTQARKTKPSVITKDVRKSYMRCSRAKLKYKFLLKEAIRVSMREMTKKRKTVKKTYL